MLSNGHRADLVFKEHHQVYHHTGQWHDAPKPSAGRLADDFIDDEGRQVAFLALNREYPHKSASDTYTWIELRAPSLVAATRAILPTSAALYTDKPAADARDLYIRRDALRAAYLAEAGDDVSALNLLLGYLQTRFAYVQSQIASFPAGMISWDLIWSLFQTGDDCESIHEVSGEAIALRIDSWAYVTESMGRFFVLKTSYYQWAGTTFHRMPATRKIPEFTNLHYVADLATKPLIPSRKNLLQERGKQYLRYARPAHARYEGFFFTRAFAGALRAQGSGEVLIDVKGFRKMNSALDIWGDDVNEGRTHSTYVRHTANQSTARSSVSPDEAYLLPPTIHGFSLKAKRWGELVITQLYDIEWQDRSFQHLVISDSYRRMIRAVVSVHASDLKSQLLSDVVEGKGNGLIIALHGTPGTGKTLTAEAIAEHLRRPLYTVSAGELGIQPTQLESKLRDILELATQWNAVLLIDEADIFLEKRSIHQLDRNALVGIFLRMLEYFSGVLILTTNSIDRFDDAFLSRFALVLRFDALDEASRRTLWDRFLRMINFNCSANDLDTLSKRQLNGRDIKHAIQTAQAIAITEKENLNVSHLLEVLASAKSYM